MTDVSPTPGRVDWFDYDLGLAQRILGGATARQAVTLTATILSAVAVVVGLTNIRLIWLTMLGVVLLFIFGIFFFVFRSAAENSRHVFGRLTGRYLTIEDKGVTLEAIGLPWGTIQRIAILDRRNEIANSAFPRNQGVNHLANQLAISAGQGETLVSITVKDGAAVAAVLAPQDKGFVNVPKKSTLPDPRPGQLILSPDVVMNSTVVRDLAIALRTAAEARGIPVHITTSQQDFVTTNYAELGVTL